MATLRALRVECFCETAAICVGLSEAGRQSDQALDSTRIFETAKNIRIT